MFNFLYLDDIRTFYSIKTGLVMSELAILMARVLYIFKFSKSLLKCLLKISAGSYRY